MEEIKIPKGKYIGAVGRRKTSVARVRIWPTKDKNNKVFVNGKDVGVYFAGDDLKSKIFSVFQEVEVSGEKEKKERFFVSVLVKGGGIVSQAGAVAHGLARALVAHNDEYRKSLKKRKFLTRDPRAKERRKFGLKKARKAPQWSKR